jgi:hypothetical protein
MAVGDSPFQEGERDVSRAPLGVAPSLAHACADYYSIKRVLAVF